MQYQYFIRTFFLLIGETFQLLCQVQILKPQYNYCHKLEIRKAKQQFAQKKEYKKFPFGSCIYRKIKRYIHGRKSFGSFIKGIQERDIIETLMNRLPLEGCKGWVVGQQGQHMSCFRIVGAKCNLERVCFLIIIRTYQTSLVK